MPRKIICCQAGQPAMKINWKKVKIANERRQIRQGAAQGYLLRLRARNRGAIQTGRHKACLLPRVLYEAQKAKTRQLLIPAIS
jgi:hypothetical protein